MTNRKTWRLFLWAGLGWLPIHAQSPWSSLVKGQPWYVVKNMRGARFYDVVQAFEAQKAQEEALEARDLTAILQNDPELYEQEGDFQFERRLAIHHRYLKHLAL